MKESLTDYATALSGTDISVLEDIIENKYLKFKKFFDLIRAHTDDIKSLQYEFDEKDVLKTEVTFKKKVTLSDKKDLIEKWKSDGYDVDYKISDKKIKVTIKYKE